MSNKKLCASRISVFSMAKHYDFMVCPSRLVPLVSCRFERSVNVKILYLPLKGQWYRMIESGVKKEEYRDINMHWIKRLVDYMEIPGDIEFAPVVFMKPYTHVEFSLGYPRRDDRLKRMRFEIVNISIGIGYAEWGAPDWSVFKIELGKRIAL